MDYNLLVDTALLAGEIMLSSGAETYRVEETVSRILRIDDYSRCDVFVVSTSIIVSLSDLEYTAITKVRSVEGRSLNLGRIHYANDIARKLCAGEITLQEAFGSLKKIKLSRCYPVWLGNTCMIVSAAAFTILFNATFAEIIIAALNGIFVVIAQMLQSRVAINRFVSNMFVCFVMAFAAGLIVTLSPVPLNLEIIIAGSIMPLLPGVAITNAVRDSISGDYVSGSARLVEAIITAASLAVGIAGGLGLLNQITGGAL